MRPAYQRAARASSSIARKMASAVLTRGFVLIPLAMRLIEALETPLRAAILL